MENFKENLRKNKFQLHLTTLLLMLIPPIPMYFAAQSGALVLVWILVGVVILGNLLVILIP
jgi:hypothetical protein